MPALWYAKTVSYKNLPLRIADFGRLHRFERTGVLHGLLRVRTMCQDDAHVFCRPDHVRSEVGAFCAVFTRSVWGFRIK